MPQPQTPKPLARGETLESAIPRRYAVLVAATTILVMAFCVGRDDQTRGPLWHSMWLISFVIVLANLSGSFARRGHGAVTSLRAPKSPLGPSSPEANRPDSQSLNEGAPTQNVKSS